MPTVSLQRRAGAGEGARGPGQFGYLNGVAASPDGFIWVADADNARVMKFEPAP